MTDQLKVPILMYHALTPKRNSKIHPIHITTELFEQEMKWLAANDYKTITIDELLKNFHKKNKPGKYCVITFDDGYLSLYKYAMPVLKQYGFKATLYLATAATGATDFSSLKSLDPKTMPDDDRPLTWQELNEMQKHGWSIQSHSVTHADNAQLANEELMHELVESKKIIEQKLHHPVLHYAFPFGKYNASSLKLVKKAGYKTSTTVHAGLCTSKNDPYRLPRLEMNSNDTIESFIKKMETGFTSSKEKIRSVVRNTIFGNPKVKDLSKKIIKRIN